MKAILLTSVGCEVYIATVYTLLFMSYYLLTFLSSKHTVKDYIDVIVHRVEMLSFLKYIFCQTANDAFSLLFKNGYV